MLFFKDTEGVTMENMDLGALIVAGLCGVGLIQLLMWIAVMFRHPGLSYLRLDRVRPTPPSSSGSGETSGT